MVIADRINAPKDLLESASRSNRARRAASDDDSARQLFAFDRS